MVTSRCKLTDRCSCSHKLTPADAFSENDGSTRSNERFPISQDQRNNARGWLRAQITNRIWTSWSAVYNSGLPVENVGDLPPRAFLVAQYGEAVVNRVNYPRERFNSRSSSSRKSPPDRGKRPMPIELE